MSAGAGAKDPYKFDAEDCVNAFRRCAEHSKDVPIDAFVDGCEEVKKIVCTCDAGQVGGGGCGTRCLGARRDFVASVA